MPQDRTSRARQRHARELAAEQGITYTQALAQIDGHTVQRFGDAKKIATRDRPIGATNEGGADLGEAAIIVAASGWEHNDTLTNVGDAVANLFHALDRIGVHRDTAFAVGLKTYVGDIEESGGRVDRDLERYPHATADAA